MNILFICHRIPYPPNKGDKIRSFNILQHIIGDNRLTLACLLDDNHDIAFIEPLEKKVHNLFFDQINPVPKKIKSLLLAFLTSQTISIPYFYSSKLQNEIDTFLDNNEIDVVFCSSSPSAEYIFRSRHYKGKLSNAKWIMDFIDMDSQKWAQYAEKKNFFSRYIYKREAKYLLTYERRITAEFNKNIIVSKMEKELFAEFIPEADITSVSNGVDLDFFAPFYNSPIKKEPISLIFTGAMDYWPNIEGTVWFAEKVLPQIQKTFPDIKFYIVGSNPDKAIKRLAHKPGIHVSGFVEDIRDYIAISDICIIPLFIARGIQNKVLEAMAMGKAIICTPQALEGINATGGEELIVAEDTNSFTKAIIELLNDKEMQKSLGSKARTFVEDNFSWAKNLGILDDILQDK